MVVLHRDSEADRLLQSVEFLEQWRALHDACPWATCFQGVPFVTTWYKCYAGRFDPVIAVSEEHGVLAGLLTLARDRNTGTLHAAGTHQAEYQVWLATPEHSDAFITEALGLLGRAGVGRQLRLLFVPVGTPLEWTAKLRSQCVLRPFSRPVMATRPAEIARASLEKPKNKKRFRRLEKMGTVAFERITNSGEFRAALDEIADLCDFRQGAISGVLPFRADPEKKSFYCGMMDCPDLLHVTVLRVGGRIAAAHIGQRNRDEVVLGLITHSPFFAEHSAGKLHLLLLGKRLEEEGFQALDLTPGGEYKEYHASGHDEVHALDVFFSRSSARSYQARRALIGLGKRFIDTNRVKDLLSAARRKAALTSASSLASSVGRRLRRFWRDHREMRIYSLAPYSLPAQAPVRLARRDCLKDLLLYSPAEAWQPPLEAFLSTAMERLEAGHHFYTIVLDGKLAHYGWLIERTSLIKEFGHTLELPPNSAVVYDFYTRPESRGRGLYRQSLTQMIHDAGATPGTGGVYIGVLKSNTPSRHVIEKVGFRYETSLCETRRFGRICKPRLDGKAG